MATVTCLNCGSDIDPGDECCGWCGSQLPRQRTVPVKQPVSPPPSGPRPSQPTAPRPGRGQGRPGQAPRVSDDPFACGTEARLRLPDGRVIALQPGDRLVVGRDQESSPLAGLCGDNISRRHAVISVTADGAYLTDTDSMNGTYLNGSKIEAKRDYRLTGRAVVSFGSDPPLRMDVEVNEW